MATPFGFTVHFRGQTLLERRLGIHFGLFIYMRKAIHRRALAAHEHTLEVT